MPPRLNSSIHSRTTRSVRQNCWQIVARVIPRRSERITVSRIYERIFGAASIATFSSSSVAFSPFGCSSGERNSNVQPHLSSLYKENFADFSNWKSFLRIALEVSLMGKTDESRH